MRLRKDPEHKKGSQLNILLENLTQMTITSTTVDRNPLEEME